jgi:hypothetical protein
MYILFHGDGEKATDNHIQNPMFGTDILKWN